nr:BRCT domain-containing protein [Aquicoccus sp. G2-2]MEA1113612.1 BRCT domain-containing protein [Aquicoccus sp. G2-2]
MLANIPALGKGGERMNLSDRALLGIREREIEERHNAFNKSANSRKRVVYWIGFLDGALSSQRIEEGEEDALLAEAGKFAEFFNDPDASDLVEDIRAKCFSSEGDLMDQLKQVIADKRAELGFGAASAETDEMNEFLGFCAGIICDGKILESEARAIFRRFRDSAILMHAAPFATLKAAVEAAMDDDVLTENEAEEIQQWIAQLVGDGFIDTGIPNIGTVAKLDEPITVPDEIVLEGSVFVLTGPMRMGPRSFIISEIESVGGSCVPRTTKKTDYVVISSTASRHWRTTHFGTKIERAKELIEEGQKLRFVSEVALEKAIKDTRIDV